MKIGKKTGYILLIILFLILGHSVYSLFKGNFQQATLSVPLLMVVYVFGIANQKNRERDADFKEDIESDKGDD